MANNNDDVEVHIGGVIDPSLAAATATAKAAIADLTQAQKKYFDLIVSGQATLGELGSTVSKNAAGIEFMAGLNRALAAQQQVDSAASVRAVESEVLARIQLTKAEQEQLAVRMAMTKQRGSEDVAAGAANFALQQRLTKQQFAEEAAASKAAAQDEEATAATTLAFRQRMNKQRASEEAAVSKSAAKETADADAAALAAILAEEKAASLSYKAEKAGEVEVAKAAAAEKVATEKVVTSVPLYAAQARLAAATKAANEQLKAGNITEEENAAAVAQATNAYNRKVIALLKSGEATKLETGEVIANTVAQNAETTAKEAFFKKLTSGRSVYEGEAAARAILTGNVGRLASATAVEATRLDLMKYAFSGVGVAVAGTIAALVAFGAAMHEATKDAEWAEKLKRTADTLGLTTTKLQEFDFVFQSLGIDVAKGEKSLSGLNTVIGQIEAGGTRARQVTKIFKDELNITPEQLRGWGDLGTQIPQIVDALSKMNVQEREAAEKRLKVDPEVIQSLIDHKNAIAGLIAEAHEYGVIIPADVIETSSKAADKMREWKTIIDGELRSAFITLAPIAAGAGQIIAHLGRDFADVVRGVHDTATAINNVIHVVEDFTGKMEKLYKPVEDIERLLGIKPTGLLDTLKEIGKQVERMMNPFSSLIGLLEHLKQLGGADRAKDEDKMAAEPKAPPQGPPPKNLLGPTEKGPKGPSIVSEWEEQLHAQEIASKNFFRDNTADELIFWRSKLALVKAGSRDWLDVQSKIFDLQKSLAHQAYDEYLAGLERQASADKDHWEKYRADLQAEADYILKTYKGDANAKAYQDQLRKIEDAEREHQKTMQEIQRREAARTIEELKQTMATTAAIRKENEREAESQIQYKAKYSGNPLAEIKAEEQIAAMKHQVMQQDLADLDKEKALDDILLQHDIDTAQKGTDAYTKAVKAKEQADLEFANKHRQMMAQMVNQDAASAQAIQQAWHAKIDPMVKFTGDEIKGLIEGTKSWGQVLKDIESQAISMVINAIEKMVEQWIVNLVVAKAAQSTAAESQVISYAGVAGAAGVASMAGAPFPIDLGAPAFGQAMAANALGFAALAGAATGTNYVPSDMVQQIHEGERIMPKADNTAIMNALTGGNRSSRGGDFHGDFGVHIHGAGGGDMDGRKVVKALEGAQTHFSKLLKGMHRNGKFAYAGA